MTPFGSCHLQQASVSIMSALNNFVDLDLYIEQQCTGYFTGIEPDSSFEKKIKVVDWMAHEITFCFEVWLQISLLIFIVWN